MADNRVYLEQYDDGNPNTDSELTDENIDELLPLIGEILVSFNSLETDLDHAIAQIVNQRSYQPGYAITADLSPVFTKKVSVFKALYGPLIESLKDDATLELFVRTWKILYEVKDIRNDITHADWLNGSADYEFRLRISSDEKGAYATRRQMRPRYLEEKVESVERAVETLNSFLEAVDEGLSR